MKPRLEGAMRRNIVATAIDKHVGARVRTRRERLKMSQTTLGKALGVSFQQVQKYEKGVNRIGAGRLQQLGGILQVPVEYFFEDAPQIFPGKRKEPAEDYVQEFFATKDGLTLTKAFSQIKQPSLRHHFVRLAQAIAAID
jgi:transcriptional regulator with XRE-family HTH domain